MEEKFELPTVGEILTQEFLEPLNITPYRLSKELGGVKGTGAESAGAGHRKRGVPSEFQISSGIDAGRAAAGGA